MAERAKGKSGVRRASAKTARKTLTVPKKKIKARKTKAAGKKTPARKTGGRVPTAKGSGPAASGRKKTGPSKGKPTAQKKSTTRKKTAAKKKSAVTSAAKARGRGPQTGTAERKRASAKKRAGGIKLSAGPPEPPAGSQDPIQFPEERPFPKTHLSDEELHDFRLLLLARRQELAGDVTNLSRGSKNAEAEAGSDHSAMPIHMADLGSDNWEHEFTLGLIANEQDRIREIDEALARIDDKTYGICLGTRKRISRARLRAKPWAKYCIDYARAREEGRVR